MTSDLINLCSNPMNNLFEKRGLKVAGDVFVRIAEKRLISAFLRRRALGQCD